ncbi:MAG: hypothetical protein JKY00_13285 [Roseicyclus sp.]|nr:hypothetical protein [Roseicyclus sp.]
MVSPLGFERWPLTDIDGRLRDVRERVAENNRIGTVRARPDPHHFNPVKA